MSSAIGPIPPLSLDPRDGILDSENHFEKLPLEMRHAIFNKLDLIQRVKAASVHSVFRDLARDDISWELLYREIDNENPVANYDQARRNIEKIYAEVRRLGIASDSTEITFEKAKELKDEVDSIKISDTIKVWEAIQKQAKLLVISYPDFTELSKKNCKEVLETFDTWINGNKDKINLTELDLHGLDLQYLPEPLCKLTQLTSLQLTNNKLQSLPDSFGDLRALRQLDLTFNQLHSLPDSFGNLTDLRILDLYTNDLQRFPDSIGNLTNLIHLILEKNQLHDLPDSIGSLRRLTILNLANNKLQRLPDTFGDLTNLEQLYLAENPIRTLPSSMRRIKRHCTISPDIPISTNCTIL